MKKIATKKVSNSKPKMGKVSGSVKTHNAGKTKKAHVTTKPINEPRMR